MQLYVGPCHVVSAEIAVAMTVPIENLAAPTVRYEVLFVSAGRLDLRLSCRRGKLSRKIVLLHDNARPHTARQTQALLREQWDIFEHPLYSPDVAPSEFFLFPKMKEWQSQRQPRQRRQLNQLIGQVKQTVDQHRYESYKKNLSPISPHDYSLCEETKRILREPTIIPPLKSGNDYCMSDLKKSENFADVFQENFSPNPVINYEHNSKVENMPYFYTAPSATYPIYFTK